MTVTWDYISARMTEDTTVTLNYISAVKPVCCDAKNVFGMLVYSKECPLQTLLFSLLIADSKNWQVPKRKETCYQKLLSVVCSTQYSIPPLYCLNVGGPEAAR